MIRKTTQRNINYIVMKKIENSKKSLKMVRNLEQLETILKEDRRLIVCDFKTYYKGTVTKTMWYYHKDKQRPVLWHSRKGTTCGAGIP